MSDSSMDGLIRKAASTQMRKLPEGCADENIIAAYLERRLSPPETAAFEEHASQCASCQEILALSMKLQVPEALAQAAEEKSTRKRTLFHFSIPIPVLGSALVVIILVAVLFRIFNESPKDISGLQTAELHTPARETESMKRSSSTPVPMESKKDDFSEHPATDTSVLAEKSDQQTKPEFKDMEAEARFAPPPALKAKGEGAMEESSPQKLIGTTTFRAQDKLDMPPASSDRKTERASVPSATPIIEGEPAKTAKLPAAEMASATPPPVKGRENKPLSSEAALGRTDKLGDLTFDAALSSSLQKQKEKKVALKPARARLGAGESRRVGDKVFYRDSGIWIDRQCTQHPNDAIMEITNKDTDFKMILQQYPELRDLLPAKIYWNSKIYILR